MPLLLKPSFTLSVLDDLGSPPLCLPADQPGKLGQEGVQLGQGVLGGDAGPTDWATVSPPLPLGDAEAAEGVGTVQHHGLHSKEEAVSQTWHTVHPLVSIPLM